MGTELEVKFDLTQKQLAAVLEDEALEKYRVREFRTIPMATVYYDTPELLLSRRRWTLRLRSEADERVLTLKVPLTARGGFSTRGEWQCQAEQVDIPKLLAAGAPQELEQLLSGQELIALCSAEFTRRAAVLSFEDGSRAELALDTGRLTGNGRDEPLRELELELLTGNQEKMLEFADYLARQYQLKAQPLSKFARAAAL